MKAPGHEGGQARRCCWRSAGHAAGGERVRLPAAYATHTPGSLSSHKRPALLASGSTFHTFAFCGRLPHGPAPWPSRAPSTAPSLRAVLAVPSFLAVLLHFSALHSQAASAAGAAGRSERLLQALHERQLAQRLLRRGVDVLAVGRHLVGLQAAEDSAGGVDEAVRELQLESRSRGAGVVATRLRCCNPASRGGQVLCCPSTTQASHATGATRRHPPPPAGTRPAPTSSMLSSWLGSATGLNMPSGGSSGSGSSPRERGGGSGGRA